jgi:hypothetical protein
MRAATDLNTSKDGLAGQAVIPMDLDTMLTNDEASLEPSGLPSSNATASLGIGDANFTLSAGAPAQPDQTAGQSSSESRAVHAAMHIPDWRWPTHGDGETPINQAIVLRRITARSKGPFPTSLQASAGPGRDGWGNGRRRQGGSAAYHFDPLDVIHRYIHSETSDLTRCSIASDSDALLALKHALYDLRLRCRALTTNDVERAMYDVLRRRGRIIIHDDGFATICIPDAKLSEPSSRQKTSETRLFNHLVTA